MRLRPGRRALAALTSACAACALGGAVPAPATAGRQLASCFWEGPISTKMRTTRRFDGRNWNIPEESATYWMARFSLPQGARLILRGRFSRARYQSLSAYSQGAPIDSLADFQTRADRGSVNPFVAGSRRDAPRRNYRVNVLNQSLPGGSAAPNTLYARPRVPQPIELIYRVYEPDRGLGLDGAAGLPQAQLVRADGSTAAGSAACREINDADRSIPVQRTSANVWRMAVASPGCDPRTNPAYNPPRWERFFNFNYAASVFSSDCTPEGRAARLSQRPTEEGALYSSLDIAYIYLHLSRRFGPLLAITGRLPTFVRTSGQPRMGRAQLRFWSLCAGESPVTARTADCLADRQLPLGRNRTFTIVVSRPEDRPRNARARCEVAWLGLSRRGDGAGRPDYSLLILRHMLADPRFANAIQRIARPGAEQRAMGPYFPRSRYTTKAQFESRGC